VRAQDATTLPTSSDKPVQKRAARRSAARTGDQGGAQGAPAPATEAVMLLDTDSSDEGECEGAGDGAPAPAHATEAATLVDTGSSDEDEWDLHELDSPERNTAELYYEDILTNDDLDDDPPGHKSGYIAIIGRPNAGKSTLLNGLVGQKLSIVSAKAQTTRHRILGIVSEANSQVRSWRRRCCAHLRHWHNRVRANARDWWLAHHRRAWRTLRAARIPVHSKRPAASEAPCR
jgi:50S ribosome-binding GTPase